MSWPACLADFVDGPDVSARMFSHLAGASEQPVFGRNSRRSEWRLDRLFVAAWIVAPMDDDNARLRE